MSSKSKDKGKSGERELGKKFEKVFGGSWVRVHGSGAFVGGANSFRQAILDNTQQRMHRGDIVTPEFLPNLVLECKFYKDFPFHSLLSNDPIPLLDGWIQQNKDTCRDTDFWLLCFKINRKGWTIVFEEKYFNKFTYKNYLVYHNKNGEKYILAELEDFLEVNKAVIESLSK